MAQFWVDEGRDPSGQAIGHRSFKALPFSCGIASNFPGEITLGDLQCCGKAEGVDLQAGSDMKAPSRASSLR